MSQVFNWKSCYWFEKEYGKLKVNFSDRSAIEIPCNYMFLRLKTDMIMDIDK